MVKPLQTDPKVTLRDIAQKLRLSHAAVSLALHDHPKIPMARRQQIQQTAREMGYLPNEPAVALSQHRRTTRKPYMQPVLAWIDCDAHAAQGRPADLAVYRHAAAQEAERLGYCLEAFARPAGMPSAALESILRERNVAGVLFPPGQADAVAGRDVPVGAFPAVCLGPFAAMSPVRVVTYDHMSDAVTAFEHIWTEGYRRIGLVLDSTPGSALYRVGFLHARARRKLAPVVPTVEFSARWTKSAAIWLRRHRPDALLFEHQGLARRFERDMRLPFGIGVALLDVPPDESRPFAGIRRNEAEIGRVAVLALVAQINEGASGNASPFCHVLVESEWIDGPSLPTRA